MSDVAVTDVGIQPGIVDLEQPDGYPVIVSAYGGSRYYHDAAARLRQDCERLGLAHDIVEWKVADNETWVDLCRRKVGFYREALSRHKNGVLWVDVDSRILSRPDFVRRLNCDLGAFLRAYEYLRDFDRRKTSRFFIPTFLYFGHTPAAFAFIDTMIDLECTTAEPATDDYFLEEAWLTHRTQMSVTIFPPKKLQLPDVAPNPDACLAVGTSGTARTAKHLVKQHRPQAAPRGFRAILETLMTLLRHLKPAAPRAAALLSPAEPGGMSADPAKTPTAPRVASADRPSLPAKLRDNPADQVAAIAWLASIYGPNVIERIRRVFTAVSHAWQPPFTAKRRWAALELQYDQVAAARALCEELLLSPDATDKAFARSLLYRIGLEERATTLGVARDRRPQLWWMEQPYPGNLGDILNPYVVEKLTGLPPVMSRRGEGALVIGSIIKFAKQGTQVWGSGTPRMTDQLHPEGDYRAVRGPLSRELALRSGAQCLDVYGDVSWFMPRLYNPDVPKQAALGLIRHISHTDRPIQTAGIKEISLERVGDEDIEAFIREMLACERVISTSLHGLILAHAYGIPAEWAAFPDEGKQIAGDGTKFLDYFASVGIEPRGPIDLFGFDRIDDSLAPRVTTLPRWQLDLATLAEVSPFAINPDAWRGKR